MKVILNVGSILAIALGAALYAAPVAAAPVSCGTAVNGYLDNTSGISWVAVTGGRVTARNGWGFSSFVMDDYFQIETHPLHTPAAAPQSHFQALRNSNSNFNVFFMRYSQSAAMVTKIGGSSGSVATACSIYAPSRGTGAGSSCRTRCATQARAGRSS